MKLIFHKKEDNEITLQLQKGTIIENFSYIEMISQLLEKNTFDDTDYGNLSDDEIERIKTMLDKIKIIFEEKEVVDEEVL